MGKTKFDLRRHRRRHRYRIRLVGVQDDTDRRRKGLTPWQVICLIACVPLLPFAALWKAIVYVRKWIELKRKGFVQW